jgi:hypothetical protein
MRGTSEILSVGTNLIVASEYINSKSMNLTLAMGLIPHLQLFV